MTARRRHERRPYPPRRVVVRLSVWGRRHPGRMRGQASAAGARSSRGRRAGNGELRCGVRFEDVAEGPPARARRAVPSREAGAELVLRNSGEAKLVAQPPPQAGDLDRLVQRRRREAGGGCLEQHAPEGSAGAHPVVGGCRPMCTATARRGVPASGGGRRSGGRRAGGRRDGRARSLGTRRSRRAPNPWPGSAVPGTPSRAAVWRVQAVSSAAAAWSRRRSESAHCSTAAPMRLSPSSETSHAPLRLGGAAQAGQVLVRHRRAREPASVGVPSCHHGGETGRRSRGQSVRVDLLVQDGGSQAEYRQQIRTRLRVRKDLDAAVDAPRP
jgi:hypothetical protein